MAVPVLATFDLSSNDRLHFLDFIQEMRNHLANQGPTPGTSSSPADQCPAPDVFRVASTSIPRLPPQQENPANAQLTDLVIRDGTTEIALRLRTDNLYVVGFRNGAGTWFELAHDRNGGNPNPNPNHDDGNRRGHRRNRGGHRNNQEAAASSTELIQGSTRLGFTGSYTSQNLGDLDQDVDARDGGGLILGEHAVREAVIQLARWTGGTDNVVRRSLRSLLLNFIESIRFNPMVELVDEAMREGVGRRLTPELAKLVHLWRNLSITLLSQPTANQFADYVLAGVRDAVTAAAALGMLFGWYHTSDATPKRTGRKLLAAVDDGDAVVAGLTLVEVVGVLVDDIDRENPGELYGSIRITDGFGTETLFSRGSHSSQSVGPGGWADLTWPTRALSGADDFVIDVHLMDHDSWLSFSKDDHVSDGQVVWNSQDTVGDDYDTLWSKRVDGKKGSVQVQYAVLTQAVVAAVRVEMVDGDGERKPDVYGTVTARTTMSSSGEQLGYKLFDTPKAHDTGVRKDTDLPLCRKVISAALGCELQIDANLWDRDIDLSPNDQIALGSATFQPGLQGTDSQEISGPYGKVKVHVTWSTSFEQHV